jgi:cytochrome c
MRTSNRVVMATKGDKEPHGCRTTPLPFVSSMLRFLVPLLAILPGLVQAQDIDRGREMAERWCASCHVVARSAQTGRADGLPTFPAIAAKQETTAASLRGVMTAAHGRMPDFSLAPRDQEDLITYIFSLRQN